MASPFILLVEDDTTLRGVLARNLAVRGYMALPAGMFREAREQAWLSRGFATVLAVNEYAYGKVFFYER